MNDLILLDKAITTGYTNITLTESTKTIRLNERYNNSTINIW